MNDAAVKHTALQEGRISTKDAEYKNWLGVKENALTPPKLPLLFGICPLHPSRRLSSDIHELWRARGSTLLLCEVRRWKISTHPGLPPVGRPRTLLLFAQSRPAIVVKFDGIMGVGHCRVTWYKWYAIHTFRYRYLISVFFTINHKSKFYLWFVSLNFCCEVKEKWYPTHPKSSIHN